MSKLQFITFYVMFLVFVIYVSGLAGISILSGVSGITEPPDLAGLGIIITPVSYFFQLMSVSTEFTILFILVLIPFIIGMAWIILEFARGI